MPLRRLLLCTVLAASACSHEEPFATADTGSNRPFQPGMPVQLTYNPGKDLRPYWAPDGESFFYAWERLGGPDFDRCIGELPASGGRNLRTICNSDPASADSTDLFDVPSPGAEGRFLYIRGSSRPNAVAPDHWGIVIGPTSDPLSGSQVRSMPFTIPGLGSAVASVADVRWLGPDRLLFLAESVEYPRPCSNCKPDTVVTGLAIVEMNILNSPASFTVYPGTDGATSLDLVPSRDTMYFTLAGDTQVHRFNLSSMQVGVAHDFGARGVPRDVTVRGQQLVAVVGGQATAGPLVAVDLTTGTEAVLTADQPLFFRRPAFSPEPAASRLLVEGYPLTITTIPPSGTTPAIVDTTVNPVADLYLYTSP